MTVKTLALLLLLASLSTSASAQGSGACSPGVPITWALSAGAGNGGSPVFWPLTSTDDEMNNFQQESGGVGPFCSAINVGNESYTAWSGVCCSLKWATTNPPPPVGGCSGTCTAGEPIDLSSGNTYIEQTDIRIPGLGGGLTLTRTWNSMGGSGTMFPGWRSNFEEQVLPSEDGTMKYVRGDGSVWSFGYYGGAFHLIAPGNGQATLTEVQTPGSPPTAWVVTFQNGEQRVFTIMPPFYDQYQHYQNTNGLLTSIIDRNGHTTTLTYQINQGGYPGPLLAVTDPVGRNLYFTYSGAAVTNVTSDSGISLTYAYAQVGGYIRLFQVTEPDATFLTYNYDTFGNIISVADINGKLLESHTYDALHRGLSSSRANGVEALAVTYPGP